MISLTSKLLWAEAYHQVKLFSGINLSIGETGGIVIHFGYFHNSKYGNETVAETPKNKVSVTDRGFCDLGRLEELKGEKDKYFVLICAENQE